MTQTAPDAFSAVSLRSLIGSDMSPRALFLGLLLLVSCLYLNLAQESYLTDFHAFYVAATATHDHLDPYVNHVEQDEMRYGDPFWTRTDSRFIYPPTALFFFSPFARIPYNHSRVLFAMLAVLTMIGILDFFHRRYPAQTLVLLALFISLPMITNVDSGQTDVFILALLLGSFYLKDGWRAGFCFGVAVAIKFAPLLALLWFLGNRRWRTAAWGVGVSGLVALAALLRWGGGYYLEFFHHMLRHGDAGRPRIPHEFLSMRPLDGFLLMPQRVYVFERELCGPLQNPLHSLGRYGGAAGLAVLLSFCVWLYMSAKGRALRPEQSFFLFLVVSLFANHLLWAMGLVACFPLLILLVDSAKTPNKAALFLLAPLMLTVQIIPRYNFGVWVIVAGYWVFENGWLRGSGNRAGEGPFREGRLSAGAGAV